MLTAVYKSNKKLPKMLDFGIGLLLVVTISASTFLLLFSSVGFRRHTPKTPCPESYPIIGNLPAFLRNLHRFHDWVSDMLSHSSSSTIGVNSFLNLSHFVCTADPANVRHLLLSNFPNYIKGSRYRSVLRELIGDGIFAADAHLWSLQRKVASHEFNTKSLKRFISDVVRSEIRDGLVPLFTAASEDPGAVLDLQQVLQQFTFNNICKLAFGSDSVRMKSQIEYSDFVSAFDFAVDVCSWRFMSPVPAIWKLKRFFNLGSEKRFKRAIKLIDDYAMEVIRAKEEEEECGTEKQDLLSRFTSSVTSMEEFKDEGLRRQFLRDIVISFILAGKDSTSTALTWFFWLINGHPRCANLILDELNSSTDEISPSYDNLKGLNYLHAALSESLRLFPPVPINSRQTVDDDVLPDGTHVRKGWFADYSAYAMGRNARVWGEDCGEYRPERWLDEDGIFQPSDQFKFPVFHGGPRVCLGKEMAYVQMKSIIAALMGRFEIVAVDAGATPKRMMDPPYALSLLLKMKGGLQVRIKKRGNNIRE